MKAINISAHAIMGINGKPDFKDIQFFEKCNLKAFVTNTINDVLFHCDKKNALGKKSLVMMFKGENIDVDDEIKRTQEHRARKYPGYLFLVIIIESEITMDESEIHRKDDFYISIDNFDNQSIIRKNKPEIDKITTSFISSQDKNISLEPVINRIYYLYKDKPLYNLNFKMSGKLTSSTMVEDDFWIKIKYNFSKYYHAKINEKVFSYYNLMLIEQDEFKKFVFAWTALEILINTSFNEFRTKFFSSLKDSNKSARKNIVNRISKVINDKFNIRDKFAIISDQVSTNFEEENKIFLKINKTRNDLLHGRFIEPKYLPNNELKNLLDIITPRF